MKNKLKEKIKKVLDNVYFDDPCAKIYNTNKYADQILALFEEEKKKWMKELIKTRHSKEFYDYLIKKRYLGKETTKILDAFLDYLKSNN